MSEQCRPPFGTWAPQIGPQLDAIQLRGVPELLFGGARGGGKSDFLLGDFCQDVGQGSAWRGVIFRRSYPELEELIDRSQTLIPSTWPGSEWYKAEKTWHLPTGAMLRMRSLEQPEDVAKFWGHQYSWMRVRASANPGGPGHAWVKARFIDPAPKGYVPIVDDDTGMQRVFIPSRLTDNRILMARDPGYIDRLRGVGSPELVRAWLEGDWNVVDGAYFPEFGDQHILRPFPVPAEWLRFRSFDWGSARPFCALWLAVSDGTVGHLPRGALVVYRELYGASAPNVGLRLSAEQVADLIRECEMSDEPVTYGVADPAMFANDGGPSIAERMAERAVRFKRADNRRVGKLGAAAGWDLVRQRLVGEEGQPMLYVFSTCTNLIRTLPVLQHDPRRPEDLDSNSDDHAADALRFAVTSRPWVPPGAEPPVALTMELLWELREREQQRYWH